jgi:putative lipoic acid-binding regulatory protein
MIMTEESVIEFPTEFPIKLMGRNTPDFPKMARALVEKHSDAVDDEAVRTAPSSNDRFVSVTVTITATSQEQLDAIYRDATDHEDVLMAL